MTIELEIKPYNSSNTSFSESTVRHRNCQNPQPTIMQVAHNPATDIFKLKCVCGLSVEFIQNGLAQSAMSDCATGILETELPGDSYIANDEGPALVVPWGS